jgi:hypothetical protein
MHGLTGHKHTIPRSVYTFAFEQGLTLVDGCAYFGNQAILVLFGWGVFYVFVYTGVFFLLWNSTSRWAIIFSETNCTRARKHTHNTFLSSQDVQIRPAWNACACTEMWSSTSLALFSLLFFSLSLSLSFFIYLSLGFTICVHACNLSRLHTVRVLCPSACASEIFIR